MERKSKSSRLRSNEVPVGTFKRPNGLAAGKMEGLAPTKFLKEAEDLLSGNRGRRPAESSPLWYGAHF